MAADTCQCSMHYGEGMGGNNLGMHAQMAGPCGDMWYSEAYCIGHFEQLVSSWGVLRQQRASDTCQRHHAPPKHSTSQCTQEKHVSPFTSVTAAQARRCGNLRSARLRQGAVLYGMGLLGVH